MNADEIKAVMEKHGNWLRNEDGGVRADLRSANLSYADLRYANLSYADLRYANLSSANLRYADLSSADLRLADLRYADFRSANLSSANLRSANLRSADLRLAILRLANLSESTVIETGETWGEYLTQTVPALLTAGGRTIAQLIEAGAWECHDWTNCPAAFAFGVVSLSQVPILFRPRVEQFVRYYDAKLIARPISTAEADQPTVAPAS